MTNAQLPVIAAIPNYNMAAELKELLPQLVGQNYQAIYVLDDGSTDDSRIVAKSYGDAVTFIAGTDNRGAGGNRNRILDVLSKNETVLIHFIDADTRLITRNMVDAVKAGLPADGAFGFITGLALDPDGRQSVWNYGPRPSLRNEIGAWTQYRFGRLMSTRPDQARRYHARHRRLLNGWPDPLQPPEARRIFWGIEQNIVFRSDVFRRYGGFDPVFRETEILELALRMQHGGLKSYFDPHFGVRHTAAQVRPYNRELRKRREGIRLAFRYGILRWLTTK